MDTTHFRHDGDRPDFNYDFIYDNVMSRLRRRLRKALFIAGSSHYFSNEVNLSDRGHCNTKIFNQTEKRLESEPFITTSTHNGGELRKSDMLALRIEHLGHRNSQLLGSTLQAIRRKPKIRSTDTIDGQIANLIEQIREIS